jgi:hypothetical protein
MSIEYIVLIVGGSERDNLVRVLTSKITELEKL